MDPTGMTLAHDRVARWNDCDVANASVRILTNHSGQKISPAWRAATTYVAPRGTGLLAELKLALRLYAMRTGYDAVVLGAGRSDTIFALLQSCLPFRRVPCVQIDCLWRQDPRRSKHLLRTVTLKIMNRSVARFCVWARRERENFSQAFRLPIEKFVFIPYHTTAVEYVLPMPTDGEYIFSGGNSDRDYRTLLEAVDGLPVRVLIASTEPNLPSDMRIPPNVDVRGYTPDAFLRTMAGCRLNVVPLTAGLLRSAGQQSFLNSMWLGKPTIVTDPEGGADYIADGVDGILVRPADPAALRAAIVRLLDDPHAARVMGERARRRAVHYTTDAHFRTIIALVREIVGAPVATAPLAAASTTPR